jgi:hypothetical protein
MIFQNEQEVINLLSTIINAYKVADPKLNKKGYKFCIDDMPDFYPNYKTAAKNAERIRIHSETGKFPESLFMNRYPNQSDAEFAYMKANYKQNTLPAFVDYISTITRPFSDGNWNIEYGEEKQSLVSSGLSFQDYVEMDIEIVKSLKDFVKGILPSIKSVDAMGVIGVKPETIYTIRNEETGEVIIDDTQMVRPQPYYYPTLQVLSDTLYDDDYFIVEATEKSMVEYGGTKQKKGHIFEVYDEESIWRAEQVGKFTDYEFEVFIYHYHGSGKIQANRLKGIPQFLNGGYLWLSPFIYACDLLDRALVNDNYLNCSNANTMFPYRVQIGNPCEFKQQDNDGVIATCDNGKMMIGGNYINCPQCKGSGLRDRVTPGGVMLIRPSDSQQDGDVKVSGNAMYYVSPETSSSEFMLKKIEMDLSKAYEVIKAKRVAQATGLGIDPGKGTATESILDVKAQYGAVKLFSDQAFSLYDFMLNSIGWQRYGNDFSKPILIAPTSFDFNTEADYLNQINAATTANVPPPVIGKLIQKYLETIYYNQKKTAKVYDLISVTDRLFTLKQDDILMKLNRNLVAPWEVILHDSALQFVDQLQMENADVEMCSVDDCTKGFFALEFKDQQEKLIQMAKDKTDAIKNVTPSGTSLVDQARQRLLGVAA